MKFLLAFLFVIFAAKSGYGTPACRIEIVDFTISHFECATNAMKIQNLIVSLSKNRTTYEAIASSIGDLCVEADSTQCNKNLDTPISGPCNDSKKLQHFRNAFRVVLIFNEFMCQNNGTTFLEFIKDSGASCYLHSSKTTCYKNAKVAAAIGGEYYFKDDSVCIILEADMSCHHHYESCDNSAVYRDYLQILTKLKEKFHCNK